MLAAPARPTLTRIGWTRADLEGNKYFNIKELFTYLKKKLSESETRLNQSKMYPRANKNDIFNNITDPWRFSW